MVTLFLLLLLLLLLLYHTPCWPGHQLLWMHKALLLLIVAEVSALLHLLLL